MERPNKNSQIILILIFVPALLYLVNLALSQECSNIGFEKNEDALSFNGSSDFDVPSPLDHKIGNNSMRILEAKPNHKRVVSRSIILNGSSGLLSFYWKKNGSYANYFNLSLYYDDQLIAECHNDNDWGTKVSRKLDDNKNESHTIKWVLQHGGKAYAKGPFGTPPTADAFIDDLDLCNIKIEKEKHIVKTNSNVLEILNVDEYPTLQDAIDKVKKMQTDGDYTIKTLIISSSKEYSLNNTLNLTGLVNLSIECDSYPFGNHAVLRIPSGKTRINITKCDKINIRGLDLRGGVYGIYLNRSSECEISSNIIADFNEVGILLFNSTNNTIEQNEIKSQSREFIGIQLLNSSLNRLEKNRIFGKPIEYYDLKFDSMFNEILDNNPLGLIYLINKTYEICENNKGFREYKSNKNCVSEMYLDKGNTLKRVED
jgi:parallel beta-helix repeat protein